MQRQKQEVLGWAGDLPARPRGCYLWLEAGGGPLEPSPNACFSTLTSSCKIFSGLCDLGRVAFLLWACFLN